MPNRVKGSRMRIWKQDPSVPHQGVRSTYISTPVENGPRDSMLCVLVGGREAVKADSEGDFLFSFEEAPESFDAVHTFAVARQVLTMYQRTLQRIERPEFKWQWAKECPQIPLFLYPRAGVQLDGIVPSADDHQHSQIFTSAVYDVLVRFFIKECAYEKYDPAETLYREGKHLMEIVLKAFLDVQVKDATFGTLAGAMVKEERKRGGWYEEVEQAFKERGIRPASVADKAEGCGKEEENS